jgi:hypothetical protein
MTRQADFKRRVRARFGGLGELTAGQLGELPHTNACARLTPAALELATRAWAAFRARVANGLGAIAAARLGELRFLGEAFDRLSREYPATRDGLSLTERRVLAGQADQIALNGIDRWIGGVHLQGHHVPWRWDDGTEAIVELPR